jgi:hypothetical protein
MNFKGFKYINYALSAVFRVNSLEGVWFISELIVIVF